MRPVLRSLHRLVPGLLTAALGAVAPAQEAGQDPQTPPRPDVPGEVPEEDMTVRSVEILGLESYDRGGVLRTLGLEVGKPYPVLRPGIQKLWESYRILMVEPPRAEVLPGGGLHVELVVEELPVDLDPRFVGNVKVTEETLLEWAMLYDREEIYVHEAEGVRSRLLRAYRRAGYDHVEIDVVIGGGEVTGSDIIFEIREGPRVRCTKVIVKGNENLPDTGWWFWRGGLKKLADVETKGRGLFRWWGGVFDREVLEADLVAMRQAYRDRGWLDAKVEGQVEYNRAGDRVRVRVLVDEGPLWRVSSLQLEAVDPADEGRTEELLYPREEILALIEQVPGTPFESARRGKDRGEITRYYGERGHVPRALFRGQPREAFRWLEPDAVLDVERHEVALTYRIVQGRPRTVREVMVTGNAHTNDRVVRRAVSVLPGEVADMREIQRSLSRVRGTGYFDDVQDPTHPPPNVTFHEVPGRPDLVDVEFEVEEGRVVDFALSGGVNSDRGAVGLIELNMRNFQAGDLPDGFWSTFGEIYRKEAFHGNGETFGVTLAPGTQVNYWRIGYSHPDIFGTHFDRYAAQAELLARDRRYRSHDEDRKAGTLTIARLFDQGDLSLRLVPRWMEVDLHNLSDEDDLPSTLLASQGESVFQGLSANVRLSKLDNRWNPREGYFTQWSNTVYGGPFGGDNDVWMSEIDYDLYLQLGSEQDDIRSGIYLGFAGGVSDTFGDTDFLNYAERFFLGGSSTLRGFDFRGVGPNDGDFSLGGETFARGTVEYRYPLYTTPIPGTSRRQEVFRGIVFFDAGILDPDSFRLDTDELRVSTGVGFGLTQPIPLVFSFGFPLREGDDDDTEVFSFRISLR